MSTNLVSIPTSPTARVLPGTASSEPASLEDRIDTGLACFRALPLRTRALSGKIDAVDYAKMLAGLWTAYTGIEQRLIAFAPKEASEALPQLRASLILEDLATLRQPGVLKSVMKASPHPPAIFSPGAAIGAIFALELIDLDAAAMVEALRDSVEVSHATAFFQICAAQSPRRWPIAERIAHSARGLATPGIAEGVQAVFDAIENASITARPDTRTGVTRKPSSVTTEARAA